MQRLVLSKPIEDFCKVVSGDSPGTGTAYAQRLNDFNSFLTRVYNTDLDSFIVSLETKRFDVYGALTAYRQDLQSRNLAKSTINNRVIAAKVYLEYNNITISRTIFKLRVRNVKRKKPELEALEKADVRKIIQSCQSSVRLFTYALLLAATGMRASEALSIRLCDINFEKRKIRLQAENTKTETARTVYLTEECTRQLLLWKKYRERERMNYNKPVVRPFKDTDYFFSSGKFQGVEIEYMYHAISRHFSASLDRAGYGARDSNKGRHHKITFHSFRRFVKTTISDLGYQDFSEGFIGHSGSTYYRKTERERLAFFHKIEPYLTYLSYEEIEAHGADVKTKLEDKDDQISTLQKELNELRISQQKSAEVYSQIALLKMEFEAFKEQMRKKVE